MNWYAAKITYIKPPGTYVLFFTLLLIFSNYLLAQEKFARTDSLRGFLSEWRSCYDVGSYNLDVRINPKSRTIHGSNAILARSLDSFNRLQIDLFSDLHLDSILYRNGKLKFTREADAVFVDFPDIIEKNDTFSFKVYFHGVPIIAQRPPWDGGFTWTQDSLNRDWVGVTTEGTGASLWWPNKDHLSDEPDSMNISVSAPSNLVAVSNGLLIGSEPDSSGYRKWSWEISYPINNYNVSLYLGHFNKIEDLYIVHEDTLRLNYYVLDYNTQKAARHFEQVKPLLAFFYEFLDEFPFRRDGYKLVESPYWGMEHQSAIAYGNDYENNRFGFDFIIVHESAHEWWGNSVSISDYGELWIHESFATYMEALFVEHYQGHDKAIEYLEMQKANIKNEASILGPMYVNYNGWNDSDMYYKGSWMLHSIRNTIQNDSAWFNMIRSLYRTFKYKHANTEDIISFMDSRTKQDLRPIFLHYLTNPQPPILKIKKKRRKNGTRIQYRWENTSADFDMPVFLTTGNSERITIEPNSSSQLKYIPNCKPEELKLSTELFYFLVEE